MQIAPGNPVKNRALLITEDTDLIDDVLHLAAAAGAEVFVAPSAPRSHWATSPLVLVGADALAGLARTPMGRRRDVVVVLSEPDGADESARALASTPEPWRDSVAIGAEHVIVLPEAARWLGDRLGAVAEGPCRDGVLVGVTGVVGGVGASTLACALALAARRSGSSVLLVDGDARGGGLDLVLGSEGLPGARWEDVAGQGDLDAATGRISATSLDGAVPHPHGIALLSYGRRPGSEPDRGTMQAVLDAGVRGYDLVIVDQPRQGVAEDRDLHHLFCVVPNRIRGIAAAAATLPALAPMSAHSHVVLRRSSRGVAPRDAERSLATTVLGEVADDPRVVAATESGDPLPDSLVRVASVLLERAGLGSVAQDGMPVHAKEPGPWAA